VTAIATDAALSREEQQIFELIGDITDDHPDAHACRLRISLAVADSPIECVWDDRDEYGRYCSKVSHVAARCRVDADDELLMSRRCQLLHSKDAVVRRVIMPQFNRYHLRRAAKVIQVRIVLSVCAH
jgi:hypothetical protein